jgi:hypothetical protein
MTQTNEADLLEIDEPPPPEPQTSRAALYSLLAALSAVAMFGVSCAILAVSTGTRFSFGANLIAGIFSCLSLPVALLGLVLAVAAYVKIRRNRTLAPGRSFALAGGILSALYTVLLVVLLAAVMVADLSR